MNKFKDLKVYNKALRFTQVVRQATRRFPKEEMFGLIAQFRRAVDSIVLNIAEGAGSSSKKEFRRFFFHYSIRSGFECIACADIALENGYLQRNQYDQILSNANEIIAMLYGLQKSLLR